MVHVSLRPAILMQPQWAMTCNVLGCQLFASQTQLAKTEHNGRRSKGNLALGLIRVSPPGSLLFCSCCALLFCALHSHVLSLASARLIHRQGDRVFCRGPTCLTRESDCPEDAPQRDWQVLRSICSDWKFYVASAKKPPMPLWPPRPQQHLPPGSQWTSTLL